MALASILSFSFSSDSIVRVAIEKSALEAADSGKRTRPECWFRQSGPDRRPAETNFLVSCFGPSIAHAGRIFLKPQKQSPRERDAIAIRQSGPDLGTSALPSALPPRLFPDGHTKSSTALEPN
jgi:hypothetical protein